MNHLKKRSSAPAYDTLVAMIKGNPETLDVSPQGALALAREVIERDKLDMSPDCFSQLILHADMFSYDSTPEEAPKRLDQLTNTYRSIFQHIKVNRFDVVIEVGPGCAPKLSDALKEVGYDGALYLIEPHKDSCRQVTEAYQQHVSKASIKGLPQTLQASFPESLVGKKVLVIANHFFDDMLIHTYLPASKTDDYFSDFYNTDPHQANDMWSTVAEDEDRETKMTQLSEEWCHFLDRVGADTVIASAYDSHYFCFYQPAYPMIALANVYGFKMLSSVKEDMEDKGFGRVITHKEDDYLHGSERWLVMKKN